MHAASAKVLTFSRPNSYRTGPAKKVHQACWLVGEFLRVFLHTSLLTGQKRALQRDAVKEPCRSLGLGCGSCISQRRRLTARLLQFFLSSASSESLNRVKRHYVQRPNSSRSACGVSEKLVPAGAMAPGAFKRERSRTFASQSPFKYEKVRAC